MLKMLQKENKMILSSTHMTVTKLVIDNIYNRSYKPKNRQKCITNSMPLFLCCFNKLTQTILLFAVVFNFHSLMQVFEKN